MAISYKPRFGRVFKRTTKKPDGTEATGSTWWIEFYRGGRQVRESSKSTDKRVAESLLSKRRSELPGEQHGGADKTTVNQLLDLLLQDYEVNGKSIAWARIVVGHLLRHFTGTRAKTIDSSALMGYVRSRQRDGVVTSTINRELSLLRRSFNLGFDAEPKLVAIVPKFPRFKENNTRKGYFEREDFLRIRQELPEHLRPVMTFAYSTGCRKGEILSLRWSQVDLNQRLIRLEPGETKNRQARILPMTTEVHETLLHQKQVRDQYYPSCPYIFSRHGNQIRNFNAAWSAANERAGLVDRCSKKLFHDLRRTGVRNLIRAGVPEAVAMKISGHKTRSVFDRYNIVDERDIVSAGKLLDAANDIWEKYKTSTNTSAETKKEAP